MKKCNTCLIEKPLDEFYKDTRSPNGNRIPRCKKCMSENYKARYPEQKSIIAARNTVYIEANRDRVAERQKRYREVHASDISARMAGYHQTPKGKEVRRSAVKRSRKLHKDKANARNKTQTAIRSGRLVPMPCEHCGAPYKHAHHEDYSRPLDVIWLCASCHVKRHNQIRENSKS